MRGWCLFPWNMHSWISGRSMRGFPRPWWNIFYKKMVSRAIISITCYGVPPRPISTAVNTAYFWCLPKGRLSQWPHEKRYLCAQKCFGVGWGGSWNPHHGGVGWVIVGWGGWDNRCYSYLSQMQNDDNCCDISLFIRQKMYSFCLNRNLSLAIEETMAAIVHKMQLFCLP